MAIAPRIFVRQLLAFCVLILLGSFALTPLARGTYSVQNLRRVDATAQNVKTLFVGSSVVVEGIYPDLFDAASPPAARPSANVGMHSCMPSEQYQLFATAVRHVEHPKLLVYGYFGNELVRPNSFDWADVIGTKAMVYYADWSIAAPVVNQQSPWDATRIWLSRPFPLLTERARLWARVEWLHRKLNTLGLPPPPQTKLGLLADMHKMAEDEFLEPETDAFLSGAADLSPYARMTVALAKDRGMRCVFVEMPARTDRRGWIAADPQRAAVSAKLIATLHAAGCETLSTLDWVGDDACFDDEVHLNASGAALYSPKLAAALVQRGWLTP